MRAKALLSPAEIREVFELIDGELWRKECVGKNGHKLSRRLVENVANNVYGYCIVRFKGRNVPYHRIIWVLLNGDIPVGIQIDHIDGNKINNDISNLRLVSNRENQQNQVKHRNGRLVGCYYKKQVRKWRAQITVNGKLKHLGYFETEQEAHEAYLNALEGLSNDSVCD